MPRRFGFWASLVLGAAFVALACASTSSGSRATPEAREFPSFVYNSSASLTAYRIALTEKDALPFLPCYCNCGAASGHRSLHDCFFEEDGSLDDHASACHVCQEEALDLAEGRAKGQPLALIRAAIDRKLARYGVPTDTPFPGS